MQVKSRQHIISLLQANRNDIKEFGVRRLCLFGSFLHERQNADSDIDLIVEFQPGGKTFDNLIRLGFYLEELFSRRVELVTPESLSPFIGPQILSEVEYVEFDDKLSTTYPHRD